MICALQAAWPRVYAKMLENMSSKHASISVSVSDEHLRACAGLNETEPAPASHDFLLGLTSICTDQAFQETAKTCDVADSCANVVSVERFVQVDARTSEQDLMAIVDEHGPLAVITTAVGAEDCSGLPAPALLRGYKVHPRTKAVMWEVSRSVSAFAHHC